MTELLIVTATSMALDVGTGIAGAAKTGSLQSGKMREGLWHKAGFVGLVALAYLLEYAAGVADIGVSVPAVSAVCVFVVVTEAVSIVENLCVLNPVIKESPIGKIFGDKEDQK